MLSPKKVIPPLAAAALPLTGTGCGGDGGNAVENFTGSIDAFCMKIAECYDETFDECLALYEDGIAYVIANADNISSDCLNAIASYYNCFADLTCEQYVEGGPEFLRCVNDIGPQVDEACYGDAS
jgi:hypothetical protein